MTAKQEAYDLIRVMPEESVKFLVELIHNMSPSFRTGTETGKPKVDVSKRLGAGIGIITDPEDFDKWDAEIEELFYGRDHESVS